MTRNARNGLNFLRGTFTSVGVPLNLFNHNIDKIGSLSLPYPENDHFPDVVNRTSATPVKNINPLLALQQGTTINTLQSFFRLNPILSRGATYITTIRMGLL